MDEGFVEYIEEEYNDQFEIDPPMHEIKEGEPRNMGTRGFEKKTVDFSKRSSGFGKKNSGYKRERGLPKREKQGPANRTRGKSPFSYSAGLQLHRNAKSRDETEPDYPEDKPRKSWGVPWK